MHHCWEAAAVRYPLFDLIYFCGIVTIFFQYSELSTESLRTGSTIEASLGSGAGSGSSRGTDAGGLSVGHGVEGVFGSAGAVRVDLGIWIEDDQTSRRTSLSFFRNSFFELQVANIFDFGLWTSVIATSTTNTNERQLERPSPCQRWGHFQGHQRQRQRQHQRRP